MSVTETDLIARAIGGDRTALTDLLMRVGPQVRVRMQGAYHWNPDLELDDVMQITYLEACQRIASFEPRGGGAFAAWLQRIARNNLNDAIRSLTRLKRTPPGKRIVEDDKMSSVALLDRLAVTTTTPSRHIAREEAYSAVRSAIDGLPDSYARVIELLDFKGFSAAEAAQEMKRTTGAIYILHCRAMDRLRERLLTAAGQSEYCG